MIYCRLVFTNTLDIFVINNNVKFKTPFNSNSSRRTNSEVAQNFFVTQQQVDILRTGTEMLNPCIVLSFLLA